MNLQKLVDTCGYGLPTNVQNFTQKDLTEVKVFQNVLGATFFEKPCTVYIAQLLKPVRTFIFSQCFYSLPLHAGNHISIPSPVPTYLSI